MNVHTFPKLNAFVLAAVDYVNVSYALTITFHLSLAMHLLLPPKCT